MFDGDKIRTARAELGLNAPALARKAKVSLDTMYRLERGDPRIQPATMAKVAAALERPIKDFMIDEQKGE